MGGLVNLGDVEGIAVLYAVDVESCQFQSCNVAQRELGKGKTGGCGHRGGVVAWRRPNSSLLAMPL